MRAQNPMTQSLLTKLEELGVTAKPGYFLTQNYCVGVHVPNVAAAFNLGAMVGAEFGQISFDQYGSREIVVFSDTRVSA